MMEAIREELKMLITPQYKIELLKTAKNTIWLYRAKSIEYAVNNAIHHTDLTKYYSLKEVFTTLCFFIGADFSKEAHDILNGEKYYKKKVSLINKQIKKLKSELIA